MKNLKSIVLLLLCSVSLSSIAQENNIFLGRDFWKTAPTVETVKAKIEQGNDPTELNANVFDGVVFAILENAPFETLTYMIELEGNGPNKLTHDGRTYIFWAAYKGNSKLMKYLLKNGAKTDIVDDHGLTILNFAANAGVDNTKVYDLCLENGADLKKDLTHDGANALLLVAPHDQDFTLIDYFTSKGLDINSKDAHGNGVFNYAAKTGNFYLMDKLSERGITGNNHAFLMAATGSRNIKNGIKVYTYLKQKGLSPLVKNEEGETPLHILAGRSNDFGVLNFMLEEGLDVNQPDASGQTPFMNAAAYNNIEVLKVLLPKVKNINAKNDKGVSALALAVANNTPEVVAFLIENEADTAVTDNNNNTLNYYLAESFSGANKKDFYDKLKLLKEHGVAINSPIENGNTWYHIAAEYQNLKLLNFVSKMGLNINAKNSDGYTALHVAAMKAEDDTVLKKLIELGADKTIKTDFEETVYDLASENELLQKNNSIIQFLK